MDPTGIILGLIGLFSLIAAIQDRDWFMENRKARIWVKLFGGRGARIFCGVLGVFFLILGVLFSVGLIG